MTMVMKIKTCLYIRYVYIYYYYPLSLYIFIWSYIYIPILMGNQTSWGREGYYCCMNRERRIMNNKRISYSRSQSICLHKNIIRIGVFSTLEQIIQHTHTHISATTRLVHYWRLAKDFHHVGKITRVSVTVLDDKIIFAKCHWRVSEKKNVKLCAKERKWKADIRKVRKPRMRIDGVDDPSCRLHDY